MTDPASLGGRVAGRTDGDIARQILLRAGCSAERIDAGAEALREACCREFAVRCPADLRAKVAPGMPELLDSLAAHRDVCLGLLTGNFEPVARLKLERAGLGSFFVSGEGAFGSDHEDRAALPAIARARAACNGRPWPREETIVIGDTPNDIACARRRRALPGRGDRALPRGGVAGRRRGRERRGRAGSAAGRRTGRLNGGAAARAACRTARGGTLSCARASCR